jgi:serine/threonine-protein kinase
MRFIQGDSLKDALRRFHGPEGSGRGPGQRELAFRQLLGRFLAVCNTIAYAHARGILHRDLKPDNVMLGPYGETLVVDWGLAKPVGHQERAAPSPEQTLRPVAASGSNPTQLGSVVGTPPFMSPEQAAGQLDRLSPASDVYSLGATLYQLLTGRAPFQDADVWQVLVRVQRGEFPPPRAVQRAVPAALEAVCLKAMALDPEERYQSALALAADLEHWLADEPVGAWREPWAVRARRWLGRHRTLVSTAAAAVLVAVAALAGATALLTAANERESQAKDLAEQQRDRAEANFRLAREAVDRFHTRVSENRLLNEPGLQPLRKELLETAQGFYRRFVKERADDPGVRSDLGKALFKLAAITNEIDSKTRAIGRYQQALALWQDLVKAHPNVIDYQRELGNCQQALGQSYQDVGKVLEAEAALKQAVAVRSKLARLPAATSNDQRDLARSLASLGVLYQHDMGQMEKAGAAFRTLVAGCEQWARAHPADATAQFRLAECQVNLANWYYKSGQTARAEQGYDRALAAMEKIARANRANLDFLERLAGACKTLGFFHTLATGQHEKAKQAMQRALAIRAQLARAKPTNLDYQEALGLAHFRVGQVCGSEAIPQEAAFRSALTVLEKLADANPAVTRFQEDVAEIHRMLANLYQFTGQTAENRAALQRALAINLKLTRENPAVLSFQKDLAQTYAMLGRFYQTATDEAGKAREAYQKGLDIWEKLIRHQAASNRGQQALALSYISLGELYQETGRHDRAEAAFQKAAGLFRKLVREQPQVVVHHTMLAGSYFRLANLYRLAGRTDRQEETLKQRLAVYQRLVREHSGDPKYQNSLASCQENLGAIYRRTSRRDQAEATYEQALALREKLVDARPTDPHYRDRLAFLYANVAGLYGSTGRRVAAEATREKELALRDQLAAEHPGVTHYLYSLGLTLDLTGGAHSLAGQGEKAVAASTRALAIFEKLVQERPANGNFRLNQATSHLRLGYLHNPADRRRQAEASFKQAAAILEKLVREQPGNTQRAVFLNNSYAQLGWLAIREGKPQYGLNWFEQAARVLDPLRKQHGQNPSIKLGLCNAHWGRANALLRLNRPAESLPAWDRALEEDNGTSRGPLRLGRACAASRQGEHAQATALARELTGQAPGDGNLLYHAAYVYAVAAGAVRQDHRLAEQYAAQAVALLARANATRAFITPSAIRALKDDELLAPLQSRADFRQLLPAVAEQAKVHKEEQQRLYRANVLVLKGDHARATTEARTAAESGHANAQTCYNAACVYAQSAHIVRQDARLAASDRDRLAERYAGRALELLRKAAQQGYRDVKHLREDYDLRPLRARPDFQKWLADLEKGVRSGKPQQPGARGPISER